MIMSKWIFGYKGYDPSQEKLREALCTLGNGYFATRGAFADSRADGTHYPGTYISGCYNRLQTEIKGRVIENEDLVNVPNWLPLYFRPEAEEGAWFNIDETEILDYDVHLNMKQGILERRIRFRDEESRITVLKERRLVHMEDFHLAALEFKILPENWSGRMEISSGIDGGIINAGVDRYKNLNSHHLETLETGEHNSEITYLISKTNQSQIRIALAARTQVFEQGKPLDVERRLNREDDRVAHHIFLDVTEGREITVEKTVAMYTSRDNAISESSIEAIKSAKRAEVFHKLVESHIMAWDFLWRRFEVEMKPDEDTELSPTRIVHLHLFHLLQTVSPNTMDLDTSVPARGLHGEAYRGHIFWDELFIFPIWNLRLPEITRSLLMYRYRRLNEARAAAKQAGYKGAMFPWQSGSDGREESQKLHLNPKSGRWLPDKSYLQRHVNAAIAYNIWQYYQVTEDMEFLSFYGAEVFLEIARFFSSITVYDGETGRYEIRNVMGPDEYHDAYPDSDEDGLNNNAYTNIMAVWTLYRGLQILEILPENVQEELREQLKIDEEETIRWDRITRKMKIAFHDGVISQFEGYEKLKEFDWEAYRKKYGDIQRLDRILESENDSPNNYKLSKQADVLMLFYLLSSEELSFFFERLGYSFSYDTIPRNIKYYESRTSHGSTLSSVVNSWVVARSDRSASWDLFFRALKSDVTDIQGGTTPEGIHLGAMAGTVDLIQRCYTGIHTRNNVLVIDPDLPEEVEHIKFNIRYRGHVIHIELTTDELYIVSRRCTASPIKIAFGEHLYELQAGESKTFCRTCFNAPEEELQKQN